MARQPRVLRARWIVASTVLVLIAFVLWQKLPQRPQTKGATAQIVRVMKATSGDMPVILDELGTVTPTATVIDPRPFQAALDQAVGTLQRDQGLLDEAKMDLVRFQRLTKLDSIARQQTEDQAYLVKQDEGTVKLDEAAVQTAKLNLSYCRITSPVAGRVGLRLVDPGEQ